MKRSSQSFSTDERKEFYSYLEQIYDYLHWGQKEEFILVINNFLKGKISLDEYIDQFYRIIDKVSKSKEEIHVDLEKLSLFKPNPKSEGFSKLIRNLLSDIRLLEEDDLVRTSDEVSPEELIRGIQKFLPRIEKYSKTNYC